MANALGAAEFADLMSKVGPYEAKPAVAVAVSGGADSLALAVLLRDWVRERDGSQLALVVDHGLRAESAEEAAWVAKRLRSLDIPTQVLRWRGAGQNEGSLQAAARAARYELLSAACARRGILHLALAHHLQDQAETFLLRLSRGSGLEGLGAMAPVREMPGLRLIRPLLTVDRARLQATLVARGLTWVEDPSNQDPQFARVRLRRLAPDLAREGMTTARLAGTARALARAQEAIDQRLAAVLGSQARLDPGGFLLLQPAALEAEPPEVGLRLLARAVTAVGGRRYGPRLQRLERLYERIRGGEFRAATLSGCRIAAGKAGLLIHREAAKARPMGLKSGARVHWDGRFSLRLGPDLGAPGAGLTLECLGPAGWQELRAGGQAARNASIPAAAAAALPCLRDEQGLAAVPRLRHFRPGWPVAALRQCVFAPHNPLN